MRKAQAMGQIPMNQKLAQDHAQMANAAAAGQIGDAAGAGAQQCGRQMGPAPLSQANLEENNRSHNKMQNRSSSKSGHTPAAPTTAQPPFQLHGSSPHGQPAYMAKPAVTQDSLHIPTSKRRKTSGQGTASSPATVQTPSGSVAATTPSQSKMASPDIRRQHSIDMSKGQAAPSMPSQHTKTLLYCPEPDCDTKATGFVTEEARRIHIEEEHVKPKADPLKFAQDCLAEAFALNADGKPKDAHASIDGGVNPPTSSAMDPSLSRQGIIPDTPMSRVASMNRQASAASGAGRAGSGVEGAKGTPGKTGVKGTGLTPKATTVGMEGENAVMATVEDPWDLTTIDPHELSNAFSFAADTVANGAIADFSLYLNSITPNDTPESKADSGWSSEPTSDVEVAPVDVGGELFAAGDGTIMPSMLDNMTQFSMQPADENDVADYAQMYLSDPPGGIVPLDTDLTEMFSKSNIELDPSLYQFG